MKSLIEYLGQFLFVFVVAVGLALAGKYVGDGIATAGGRIANGVAAQGVMTKQFEYQIFCMERAAQIEKLRRAQSSVPQSDSKV